VADICVHESVCKQRNELCEIVGYMRQCVDIELNSVDSPLHEAVCGKKAEIWLIICFLILTVFEVT